MYIVSFSLTGSPWSALHRIPPGGLSPEQRFDDQSSNCHCGDGVSLPTLMTPVPTTTVGTRISHS